MRAVSREWQQRRLKEYVLPDAVYYQTVWAVRDLERMEKRIKELDREIRAGHNSNSIVCEGKRNYSVMRPTESRAVEKVLLEGRVKAIRNALNMVPESYRGFIMDNIVYRTKAKGYASKIWRIWKQRFLYQVARNLSLI